MSEWPVVALGEVTTKIGSGATPRGGESVYQAQGVSLIRSQNVLDNSLRLEDIARISDSAASALRHVTVEATDVLINITGDSVARCAVVDPKVLPARVNQHVAILRPAPQLHPLFLQKLLVSPDSKSRLLTIATAGGTRNALTKSQLTELRIPLPPLPEQRAIAEVLGALDDKIAANAALAATRRSLARAAWYHLGRGAQTTPLGDLVETGLSGVWGEGSRSPIAEIEALAFRGRDLADILTGQSMDAPHRWISKNQASRRIAPDALEIWTAGSGTLGPTLLITPALRHSMPLPVTYSNFVKRLVPREGQSAHLASAWFAMWEDWDQGEFENYRTGTAMPNLDIRALLSGVQVPLLHGSRQAEIQRWAGLVLQQELTAENRTLAAIRDALLPALMSGELRVKDANRAVSEAGV